jgi:hypothetical protein
MATFLISHEGIDFEGEEEEKTLFALQESRPC